MKKYSLLLLMFSLLFSYSYAQDHYFRIPLQKLETRKCKTDTSSQIEIPKNVNLFHTDDNSYLGNRTELCESFIDSYHFSTKNIDKSIPFFIEIKDINTSLLKNMLYFFENYSNSTEKVIFKFKIPSEFGDSSVIKTKILEKPFMSDKQYSKRKCFATDNYQYTELSSVIIKINPIDTANEENIYINLSFESNYSEVIRELTLNKFYKKDDGSYEYNFDGAYSHLVGQNPFIYPSPINLSVVDVQLEDNVQTPTPISIIVEEYSALTYQSYTSLQGGLVLFSDEIRHPLEVVDDGGNFCIMWVDVLFSKGTSFRYKAGDIQFNSKSSCFYFDSGSKFIIDENTYLNYGQSGIGMLALKDDSEIILKQNAELEINNTVVLIPVGEESHTVLHLKKGTSFSFGKHGHIRKGVSNQNLNMSLDIYMEGGHLDLSNLSHEEKNLIHLIYPKAKKTLSENIQLQGNLIEDNISFSVLSNLQDDFKWSIVDINGRLIQNGQNTLEKGINYYNIDFYNHEKGIYFLVFEKNGEMVTRKLITI